MNLTVRKAPILSLNREQHLVIPEDGKDNPKWPPMLCNSRRGRMSTIANQSGEEISGNLGAGSLSEAVLPDSGTETLEN